MFSRRNRLSVHLARGLILALAALIVLGPQDANAQFFKKNRKWIFSLAGAALTAVPAWFALDGQSVDNDCSGRTCATVVSGIVGAGLGFMIGREMDSRYARETAAGPSMDYQFQNVPLGMVPDRMTGFQGGAAVVGLGGARVVLNDGTSWARGVGVRGIEDVAVVPNDLLVLSTVSSLIAFPVYGDSVQGEVIDERGGSAMETVQNRLAVAGLDSLRVLRVQRSGDRTGVETISALESLEFVTDLAYSEFDGVAWALIGDRLVAYSPDLERLGEFQLPAPARTVRAHGSRLAVAAGSHGAFVLDVSDPASPELVQEYTGIRFAFGADLAPGDLMYVAAGREGTAVVDIGGAQPQVVGVARNTGFASDVVVGAEGRVWILDRDGRQIQIADFQFSSGTDARGGSNELR